LQQENISFDDEALTALARVADGSMRDALSLLDQSISYGEGKVLADDVHQMLGTIEHKQVLQIITALVDNNGKYLLTQAAEISDQGRDFSKALDALLSLLQRLSMIQMVPDLEADELEDHQQLQALSHQISAEQVQLLYQIALHGKRDLPYASDPRSGFEMTLLRMLSFQPKNTDTASLQSDANPVQAVTANKVIATDSVQKPIQQQQKVSDITPVSVAKSRLGVKEESAQPVEKDPVKTAGEATISADNWTQIISKLKLVGLARQLADNVAFIRFEKDLLQLSLAEGLAHLARPKTQEKLQKALDKYLNHPIKISFTDTSPTEQPAPTLASQQAEQQSIQQQRATDSIHNDPAIDALKQSFDARIIESSIKPIN